LDLVLLIKEINVLGIRFDNKINMRPFL